MSVSKYKRILNIAESLLQKVELPKETLSKYFEIKDSILLSEESVDYSDQGGIHNSQVSPCKISFAPDPISAANVLNKAHSYSFSGKDEVGLAIREQIITILNLLSENILDSFSQTIQKNLIKNKSPLRDNLSNDYSPLEGGSDTNSRKFNSHRETVSYNNRNFINKLAMKKVEIKEIMEELPSTELKFINRKWLDEVDTIEGTYMKYLSLQENLEEAMEETYTQEKNQKYQLETIKENFGEKIREIEDLKFEKEKLIEIIKDEGLALPNFEISPAETVKQLKETLKDSHREAKKLQNQLSKEEKFEQLFYDNFIPFLEKYDIDAECIDINNKNDVQYFIKDLLQKMEEDNKWLIEKVELCEKINCELIKIEKEMKVKYEKKNDDVNNFVGEVKNVSNFILQDKTELDSVKMLIRDFMEEDLEFIKQSTMNEASFEEQYNMSNNT